MSEAGLIGIGNMGISRYAMAFWRLEQRVGFQRHPFALERSAAGRAAQWS